MLIKLDHVEKQYSGFHLDCTMEVPEGSVTALIGPNGAGKSTTFKALLGLIFPEKGRIELLGKPVEGLSREEKEDIGVVLSDSCFTGYLSIEDILPVLGRLYRKFDRQKFLNKCQDFGLAREKKIKELSTGMKAKLKILMALSHEARLLILDEPTAGLDVLAREEILDLLREYMIPGDRSILISSHISTDLESFCDDIYLIDEGKIVLHEDTDILLSSYGILKVTPEQYGKLDKRYLLSEKREDYGYRCLTNEKRFYQENYPDVVVENGGIDELILMREGGRDR